MCPKLQLMLTKCQLGSTFTSSPLPLFPRIRIPRMLEIFLKVFTDHVLWCMGMRWLSKPNCWKSETKSNLQWDENAKNNYLISIRFKVKIMIQHLSCDTYTDILFCLKIELNPNLAKILCLHLNPTSYNYVSLVESSLVKKFNILIRRMYLFCTFLSVLNLDIKPNTVTKLTFNFPF